MSRAWYVLQTFSQYEKKIEQEIKLLISEGIFGSNVLDVKAPIERVEEIKNGKKRIRERKIWPGYILIELDLPEQDWKSTVANIIKLPGVVNFVGTNKEQKPLPISDEEVKSVFMLAGEIKADKSIFILYDFEEGERVRIKGGPFDSFEGIIGSIDYEKKKLKVAVQIFGRSTPVEVDFQHIEKI
ncbi:Transcription antitermination protein nusG [Borrelia nietonii YOR]|uniref:Transcription termination/antitermination protein NusG n=1 Tax=Borrelia nietonii YOR TaxID=1293576 RepID=A0ABN4C3S2_9SPIR|nr:MULTISPECIES: transcription termination/antitermination protein NusG [Borrelia]AHH03376.1 Transcription antitermination protein nusG [Borrelia nietonii YOR]AHH13891.1 Transcription antitermination protein nusG [Borrelia hermsii MTW]UPA09101.1 transcription termination/antitermination factor NusG [Borrelia nietonii YOR]